MYLGFNYDLARGMQDELLRWAEEQRTIKQVRMRKTNDQITPPRSAPELFDSPRTEPTSEEALEVRRAS